MYSLFDSPSMYDSDTNFCQLRRLLSSIWPQQVMSTRACQKTSNMILPRFRQQSSRLWFSTRSPASLNEKPASEYLYGHSAVLAAIKAKKRRIDMLFFQKSSSSTKTTKKKDATILEDIVQKNKLPIVYWDKGRMNNLVPDKPHQGYIMKTSPLDTIDIAYLGPVENGRYATNKPDVNFTAKNQNKAPFWIALDEIQDPQNLGSILRTAYFFQVDGVLLCRKNSAPLSPTVSKVSAGAMEQMDVHSTASLVKFLKASSENGWNIMGAAATDQPKQEDAQAPDMDRTKPRILVLGSEGLGLRKNVLACCNERASIPGGMLDPDDVVDSLNVGVAAGILISKLT
ncbi:Alpha/beta knot methyltransferase [Syncephalastrum racemosum]|uniref:rRNA methyltransferase 1, mitochondrial n=1 Tax=Syncephalastrum racemosum TaxID=13706 RepID=A0A1X2HNY2_SYNRA|nr:Alpha/beta knot methyltransferase [Syncephalastrum racemosum]